jgi:hypothetical protein
MKPVETTVPEPPLEPIKEETKTGELLMPEPA